MLLINHGYSRDYKLLQDPLVKRLELTSTVYNKAELIPKDHYSLHLCDHYFRAGEEELKKWMDCWPHERKHRVATRCAKNIANTSVYEKSIAGRFYMEQKRRWQNRQNFEAELSGSAAEVPGWLRKRMKCSTIAAAAIVAFHGMQYGVGDVVLVGSEIMIVEFCVIAKSRPYAVARTLPIK